MDYNIINYKYWAGYMKVMNPKIKPFLRWAGGKTWLLNQIDEFTPKSFNNYHEPFLGGGSVFFYLQPDKKASLSDSNAELINAYIQIRDNVESVIKKLKKYVNTKEEYYRIRENRLKSDISKAAKFIYLNRTNFNGIYRVNAKGKYNVPYGFKEYQNLFEFDRIRNASEVLQGTKIKTQDFECSMTNIRSGDFVFLDPPYTVSHVKNGFIKYNEKLFSWEDQKRLAYYIKKIKEIGAYYILTNAKHDAVRELYGVINTPIEIERHSVIGGKKAERGLIQEYIFSNIDKKSGGRNEQG